MWSTPGNPGVERICFATVNPLPADQKNHDRSILREGESEEGDVGTPGSPAQERAKGFAGHVSVVRDEALPDTGKVKSYTSVESFTGPLTRRFRAKGSVRCGRRSLPLVPLFRKRTS